MGIKASYEASVAIRDVQESARLATYITHLQELEDNLPYPEADRRKVAGLASPMVVVRDIARAGDARAGYQAVATNLPNDPKVHEKKGTKKIFWKNMFEARVGKVIVPISRELMVPEQAKQVSAQGVFENVMMHELSHALGPRYVRGTGEKDPVNLRLGDFASAIEEMKATVAGLVSMAWFFDHGVMPKETETEHYASYLGSIFRAVRFGIGEAHGRAAIVELNFGREKGSIVRDPASGRWSVDPTKMRDSLRELTAKTLEIERAGDRAGSRGAVREVRHASGRPRQRPRENQGHPRGGRARLPEYLVDAERIQAPPHYLLRARRALAGCERLLGGAPTLYSSSTIPVP